VKKLLIISLLVIICFPSVSLSARDYKKTEDMITSILSEEGEAKPVERGESVTPSTERDKQAPGDEEKRERRRIPAMTGKDAVLLKSGIELYNSGMMESSLAAFNDIINNYTGSPFSDSARIWAGRIILGRNQFDEAIAQFAAVGENSGEYPASLFYTGEAFRYKGDLNRSIETFKKLYNSYPENEFSDKGMLISGKLYLQLNRGYQSLEAVIGIIKNYSDRDTLDDAYYLMAKIYERDPMLRDLETARRVYRIFLRKAGKNEKYFKDSPLLPAVVRDLDNLEKTYFRLER
jgi:TolA-binding protein